MLSQIKASAKYDKANTKSFHLKLNKKTDKDIIDRLDSVDNKQGYVKGLIRKDIKEGEYGEVATADNPGDDERT